MSEFDDFMAESLEDAGDVIGTVDFFISGKKFCGDLSELGNNAFVIVLGGKDVTVSATLIAARGQFGSTPPAQDTRLKCQGKTYRVASFSSDSVSIHLQLASADSH